MKTGGESKPSASRPHSSFVVGFIGPSTRRAPCCRAQANIASNNCRLTAVSFTHSKKPKNAALSFCARLWWWSMMPAMRPTSCPLRAATHSAISACSKQRIAVCENLLQIHQQRRHPMRVIAVDAVTHLQKAEYLPRIARQQNDFSGIAHSGRSQRIGPPKAARAGSLRKFQASRQCCRDPGINFHKPLARLIRWRYIET